MKVANVEEMRQLEQAADAGGQTYAAMMDMAGRAVAQMALTWVLGDGHMKVVVLVGPGNNGGDGLVASRALLERGVHVTVYFWRRNIKGDDNFQRLRQRGRRRSLAILWADNDESFSHLRTELKQADLVIDALLGTGVARPMDGKLAALLEVVKAEIAERRAPPSPEVEWQAQWLLPRFPIAEAQILGTDPDAEGDDEDEWDDDPDEDWEAEPDAEPDEAGEGSDDGRESAVPPPGALRTSPRIAPDQTLPLDLPGVFPPPWPALPVLAVDCPSGLNSDDGSLDPAALPAELTVTFGFPKWGHLQYPGAGACGLLAVAGIGLPPNAGTRLPVELMEPRDIAGWLPARSPAAHKGDFGRALIAAGSLSYTGAAYLAGAAALRAGAGLVTLAIPRPLHPALAGALPEVTWLLLPGEEGTLTEAGAASLLGKLPGYAALLVGPGLTTEPGARAFVEALLAPDGASLSGWPGRLVVDADALNILSELPDWPKRLPPETILTPHPGEMARLTGLTSAQINSARIATTRRYAADWGQIVLLKGAHTVIAAPDGRAAVLPFANPALATAGSGDVLAGAIAGMLAQGLPPFEAAVCGGYVHGHAGQVALRELGAAGVIAGDLLRRLPAAMGQIRGE